ncbi:orotate phosphoribosyltransferase [Gammaproteobacteria bacterium]|nr:orotate phosphoribosyltransferase [Gammaproteobacteria bacterium]
MSPYKKDFINLAIFDGVLKFGEFTLKSGRVSPYFFNLGNVSNGKTISSVGSYYAETIMRTPFKPDGLFGPAYKGIPLVVTTAIALSDNHEINLAYAFNRKEEKDHGEGGNIIGKKIKGDVIIVDDVISSGASIREACEICTSIGANPVGAVVSIDRQEIGRHKKSSTEELEQELNLEIYSIITLDDVIQYLEEDGSLGEHVTRILKYKSRYGVK